MHAEQIIKKALDGKFYRLDVVTGNIVTKTVPLDYIPDHRPTNFSDIVPDRVTPAHVVPWDTKDDEVLLRMRGEGMRWEAIARALKRALYTLRTRYDVLCAERGITPAAARAKPATRLSDEAKAEIVRLRNLGMGFREINEALGLDGYTARDYFSYYTQKKRLMRAA